MNFAEVQILDLSIRSKENFEASDEVKGEFLSWVADSPLFNCRVGQTETDTANGKSYRFSVEGTNEGKACNGSGRSRIREEAAVIASAEMIERFVAKHTFSSSDLLARHIVKIEAGEISVSRGSDNIPTPSAGLRSTNGWAVHFSLNEAIKKAALEALERHILLYTYLKEGWDGFRFDDQFSFNGVTATPALSHFSFGGFAAGIVPVKSRDFPGNTFGYLCDNASDAGSSNKWLGAFFEGFDQVDDIIRLGLKEPANCIEEYQKHFLTNAQVKQTGKTVFSTCFESISGNIIALDLKQVLSLAHPFYAAFVFGGDLIPLVFKQKLTAEEMVQVGKVLKRWNLSPELPEVHPIL